MVMILLRTDTDTHRNNVGQSKNSEKGFKKCLDVSGAWLASAPLWPSLWT